MAGTETNTKFHIVLPRAVKTLCGRPLTSGVRVAHAASRVNCTQCAAEAKGRDLTHMEAR